MAVLIPDVPKSCPTSERYIYGRLGRELPDSWIVLHSLGLGGHESKIWGEADIVILSELGIFALEVKGGTVNCVDGVWRYSGEFETFTKRESPWAQAMSALAAVRKHLCEVESSFGDVLFGFGVVMPYTTFTASGSEIIPEVLLDQRSFRQPLRQYIISLQKYWNKEYIRKRGRQYRGLTRNKIHQARQILRPDLETALSLGGYLTSLDDQLVQLTNEQIQASRRMAANPRTVVRGPAGTGKSLIALDRALRYGKEQWNVLFICYNRLLASHVKYGLRDSQESKFVHVYHAHALYRKLIEEAGINSRLVGYDEDSPDFFAKYFPELAVEALCEKPISLWDVLVVDEAQDLLTPEHLDVFDLLLQSGLSRGCWHLFLDPLQNIYSDTIQETVTDRLSGYAPTYDDLFTNCRNTRQIAVQTSIISGIDLPVVGAPDGQESQVHYYSSKKEAIEILDNLIRELVDSQVRIEDIVILSTRRLKNSLLKSCPKLAGFPLVVPEQSLETESRSLMVSTMHAFKGLDRQVVIAIDMAEIGNEKWSMLHYTGLSRARVLLHVLLPANTKDKYEMQARAFGERLQSG